MKKNNIANWCLGLLAVGFLWSCQQKSTYTRTAEQQLATGQRTDTIFLEMKFGIRTDSFFNLCRRLNREQIIRDGYDNRVMVIHYDLGEKYTKAPAAMDFFPVFKDTSLVQMGCSFTYNGWSPTNKDYSANQLLKEVKPLVEKWYGTGFFSIGKKQGDTVWAKIDNNRRILLFVADDHRVRMLVTDLSKIENPTAQVTPQDLAK